MITEKNLAFRYDINALRAIAVTAVILYHYKFGFLNGGFAGVDIFFVISGFLMTKIILAGLQANKFSFINFYLNRLHRIAPALIFMVTLVTLTEAGTYFPWNFKTSASGALASLLFYSNVKFVRYTGYFEPGSAFNAYLHTWSLSVEFQFYLLYPLLLLALRNRTKQLFAVLAGISFFSFGFSVWLTYRHPDASFYLLPSRCWELLAGGMAFIAGKRILNPVIKLTMAVSGFLVMLASLFLLSPEMKWPGYYTLVPVLSAAVIIAAGQDFRLLKTYFIQYTGKISYSLYLWHWPVLVMATCLGFEMSVTCKLILTGISLVLASFSYLLVESRIAETKKLVYALGLAVLMSVCCSRVTVNSFIFRQKNLELADYLHLHEQQRSTQFSGGRCFIESSRFADYKKGPCMRIDRSRKNYLLIGDSHAAELSMSLRSLLVSRNINLLQATATWCLPFLHTSGISACSQLNDYIFRDFLVHHASGLDGIILSGNWADTDRDTLSAGLSSTLNYLHKLGLKTILIGQTEHYSIPYPEIAAREFQYQIKLRERFISPDCKEVNELLKLKYPSSYIDIYNQGAVPPVLYGDIPYYWDQSHLSVYGADLAVRKILSDPVAVRFLGI